MTAGRIVVLDGHTVNPGDTSWSALEAEGELVVYEHTEPSLVVGRARDADVVVTNKTLLDASAIAALPKLRGICVIATGVNVVDVAAARARDIPVCNVPAYGTGSVVEHTFALLFELCRQVGLHDRAVHAGEWVRNRDFSFWKTPQIQLEGRVFGVIGHGNIGSAVARVARAFGMSVLATPSRRTPLRDAEVLGVDAIFRRADVISLHCPLVLETRELVRRERLELVKPSALLVNTARGGLIHEGDLAQALERGALAGAALDVLSEEPPRADNPLLRAPRCLITPHVAWATLPARARLIEVTAANARGILHGAPIHVVN
jgi:glycerate dehydrogenase